jgi:hypothetical protein
VVYKVSFSSAVIPENRIPFEIITEEVQSKKIFGQKLKFRGCVNTQKKKLSIFTLSIEMFFPHETRPFQGANTLTA